MSKQGFGKVVEEALQDLPEPFASHLEEVRVEVLPRPTPEMLADSRARRMLGLYVGHPLTHRELEAMSGVLPDVIYIFQRNLEAICNSRTGLIRQVRITVLHEIGHFFGMDEEDLDKLGYG